jgi:hypothetical protein
MSFYFFTIVIPLAMVLFFILRDRDKYRFMRLLLHSVVKSLPYQYFYLLLLYFLETEDYIESGWVFYSFGFFLIPISVIALVVNFFVKKRQSSAQ